MAFNLDDLGEGTKLPVHPISLFKSLKGRAYSYLRDEQTEILAAWYDRRDEKNLIITQNTGGGKTLTGLLIAYSSMLENSEPVVYLVADRFLVNQAVEEAQRNKIPVTTETDWRFQDADRILITTYHKLINGLSTFGTVNKAAKHKVSTIILDDAHRTIETISSQFSLRIKRKEHSTLYNTLLELFKPDLDTQEEGLYLDYVERLSERSTQISPIFLHENMTDFRQAIASSSEAENNGPFTFQWPPLADALKTAIATVTGHEIEITTPCPNIHFIPALKNAKRKIFLTATVGDIDDIITHFDVSEADIERVVSPKNGSDVGERLILTPTLAGKISDDVIPQIAFFLAYGTPFKTEMLEADFDFGSLTAKLNVVVLVPNNQLASNWSPFSREIHCIDTLYDITERLKKETIGLVVLVNKYDGVDLPDDACRVLIIDGAYHLDTPSEQRRLNLLMSTDENARKTAIRLEQGMGRAVRSNNDHCVVLVRGSQNTDILNTKYSRQWFSRSTAQQLQVSSTLYENNPQIYENQDVLLELIQEFLDRNSQLARRISSALPPQDYQVSYKASEIAFARRTAFNLAMNDQQQEAVNHLRKSADTAPDSSQKALIYEEAATYGASVNAKTYNSLLETANQYHPRTLKPQRLIRPSSPVNMQTYEQARLLHTYLKNNPERYYEDAIISVFDAIHWKDDSRTTEAEIAFKDLGSLLGLHSSRRDTNVEQGPDVLWQLNGYSIAIELKTGVTRNSQAISKSEIEQLTYAQSNYLPKQAPASHYLGLLVHPYSRLERGVHLADNQHIVGPADLHVLRERFMQFSNSLSKIMDPTPDDIALLLDQHRLGLHRIIKIFMRP